jgi:hypothetical protein
MNRLERRNYGSGHSYMLDGTKVPGVTTIIGKLDKPALIDWAARKSAGYAIDHWDELTELPLMERAKLIQDARWDSNKKAIVRGNRIHALAEKLGVEGEAQPPAELLSQVEAYARFLDRWDMESVATEASIAHTEYRYAGTLDAIVKSPKLGTILMDVKTGQSVWGEVALQLAAYRYADLLQTATETVGPRGGRKAGIPTEEPMPPVDACYVAHVLGDDVELLPVSVDEYTFETFLYLQEIYLWHEQATNRNSEYYRPPVGAAIYPEQVQAS